MLVRIVDTTWLPTSEGDRLRGVANSLAAKGCGPVHRHTGDPSFWQHVLERFGTSTLPGVDEIGTGMEPEGLPARRETNAAPGLMLRGVVYEPAKPFFVSGWLLAPARPGDIDVRDGVLLLCGTEALPGKVVMEPRALASNGKANEPPGLLQRDRAITPLISTGLLLLTAHLAGEGVACMARSIDSELPIDVRRTRLVGQGTHLGGRAAVARVEHTLGVAAAG